MHIQFPIERIEANLPPEKKGTQVCPVATNLSSKDQAPHPLRGRAVTSLCTLDIGFSLGAWSDGPHTRDPETPPPARYTGLEPRTGRRRRGRDAVRRGMGCESGRSVMVNLSD